MKEKKTRRPSLASPASSSGSASRRVSHSTSIIHHPSSIIHHPHDPHDPHDPTKEEAAESKSKEGRLSHEKRPCWRRLRARNERGWDPPREAVAEVAEDTEEEEEEEDGFADRVAKSSCSWRRLRVSPIE